MTAKTAPITKIRSPDDIIGALATWPVGQQARHFGVSDDVLAGFYLAHVLVGHALHARLGTTVDDVYELVLFGDAHRAQNMPLFAAPGCTSSMLQYLLAAPNLNRVRLVTPSPSIVPSLDPSVRRLFPSLTAEGIEVRSLRHAARADSPDAFVILPTTDPVEFELERGDHALWRHIAERVAIVGVSSTRAEATITAAYLDMFGVTVTDAIALPIGDRESEDDTHTLGYAWQILARRPDVRPTCQRLERFGRLLDLLREDDVFPDDLFGACIKDPSGPYIQLVHGHWLNIAVGTIHYVADVDELLEAHEPPQAQDVSAQVSVGVLARRPDALASQLDRWYWVLDAFEDARPFHQPTHIHNAPQPRSLTP